MWPAPEISLQLHGHVDAVAVENRAGVHIPHASTSLGPEHQIVIEAGDAQLEIRDHRTVVRIHEPGALSPQAVALLAASRAAARRERVGAVTLRAAAVGRAGAAILLAGPALAGKTSIARAMQRSGWSVLASNAALVRRDGMLLGGSRNMTARAIGHRVPGDDPFALRHVGWLEPLRAPVPVHALAFVASAPGGVLAAPLQAPELELLNATSEIPRLCVALTASMIDVGLDSPGRARDRLDICREIAAAVSAWRVTGPANRVAAWLGGERADR